MAIRWDLMGHHSEMNMHTCLFNHERLVDYVSGNCTPEERLAAERHLAHCPECRREILELEKTWWALDVWQEETPPAPVSTISGCGWPPRRKSAAPGGDPDAMGCRLALLRFGSLPSTVPPRPSLPSPSVSDAACGLIRRGSSNPVLPSPGHGLGSAATVPVSNPPAQVRPRSHTFPDDRTGSGRVSSRVPGKET